MRYLLLFALIFALGACKSGTPDQELTTADTSRSSVVKEKFQISTASQEISLSWPSIIGAKSYNLYWSEIQGGALHGVLVSNILSSQTTLTGFENGKTYYFVVTALLNNGESAPSAEISAFLPLENTNVCRESAANENTIGFASNSPVHDFSQASTFSLTNELRQSSSNTVNNIYIQLESDTPAGFEMRFIIQQNGKEHISPWFNPSEDHSVCYEVQHYLSINQRTDTQIQVESHSGVGKILGIGSIKPNPDYIEPTETQSTDDNFIQFESLDLDGERLIIQSTDSQVNTNLTASL